MKMKIKGSVLKSILREIAAGGPIVTERPWSIESEFVLGGGVASDSEGLGPDGVQLTLMGSMGSRMTVDIDTYWNPHKGDQSGNSIKIDTGAERMTSYVPFKMDDGRPQRLIVSNSPVQSLIAVSHAPSRHESPVLILVVRNPFNDTEQISPSWKNLGNGTAAAKIVKLTRA
jgi:hypothetical protein